jgi:hypothetical protein
MSLCVLTSHLPTEKRTLMFTANTVFVSKGSKDTYMIKIDGTYFSVFVLFPMTERLWSATLNTTGLTAALSEQKWLQKKNSANLLVK